jgi:oxygen-independent coproporphyrinogen-3 oxidase
VYRDGVFERCDKKMNSTGVYIHIPFCRKKCDYCGFYSVPACGFGPGDVVPDSYVSRLVREIRARLDGERMTADTVYFGGGTPSMLTPAQVGSILGSIAESASVDTRAEVTLEMNPEDVSCDNLSGFRDAGVNRIVLGMQTLSTRLHKLIGRSGGVCTTSRLDLFFSVGGFQHCLDIIIGMPSQSEEELCRDLDTAAGYRPVHISAYLLSLEKGTPLCDRLSAADFENRQARLFTAAGSMLQSHGYERYEISNFALPGLRSCHNLKYWMFDPYIGFGPGSSSFIRGERFSNKIPVADYIGSDRVLLERDARTLASAAVEFMMTGLRLSSGISIRDAKRLLGFALPAAVMERIGEARSSGMVHVSGDGEDISLRLSEEGIMFADSVIYRIVEPLL